jgi:shikimate kinase
MCAFFFILEKEDAEAAISMELQKKKKSLIFLAGFMGSGKSTVGPILANTLGYQFLDIDKFIEDAAQKSIPEIFRIDGEAAFRNLERTALCGLSSRSESVVALGGGTIANEENLQFIKKTGILVYLKISPEQAMLRVQHHRTDRPMLKDEAGNPLTAEKLKQRIIQLLEQREKFYLRSDIVVDTDNLRIGMSVDEIVKKVKAFL